MRYKGEATLCRPLRPAVLVLDSFINLSRSNEMHLFATREGDRWLCSHCREAEQQRLEEEAWEWIFDRDDQTLRCALCGHPDFDFDD
jgi:hypothetical protein